MEYYTDDILTDQFYTVSNQEQTPNVPWLFRFISFLSVIGFIMCFIQPWIGPVKEEGYNIAIRWVGFAFCTALLLGIVALCPAQKGTLHTRLFLGIIFFMMIMMFTTELLIGFYRINELFGAFVFAFGIFMFVSLWPRVAAASGESILTFTLVICALAEIVRMRGDVAGSNSIAAFCGSAGAALTVISFRRSIGATKRVFAGGGALLMVVFLILAQGRASILGLGAAVLICLWLGSGKARKGLVVILLLLFIFFLMGTLVGKMFIDFLLTKGRGTGVYAESTLARISGRMLIWENLFRASGGILWLGKGRLWTSWITEGHGTHSAYLEIYFNYGLFAAIAWFVANSLLVFVTLRVVKLHKATETYPIAPVVVIFFLIFGMLESWLSNLLGARGLLFFCAAGLCFYELSNAQSSMIETYPLEQTEQDLKETGSMNYV